MIYEYTGSKFVSQKVTWSVFGVFLVDVWVENEIQKIGEIPRAFEDLVQPMDWVIFK